jgi:hypothetical protein
MAHRSCLHRDKDEKEETDMTNRQFYFSGLTGGFLMAAGGGLVSLGVAAGGLFLVGAAITGLTVAFRFQGLQLPALLRMPVRDTGQSRTQPGLTNG